MHQNILSNLEHGTGRFQMSAFCHPARLDISPPPRTLPSSAFGWNAHKPHPARLALALGLTVAQLFYGQHGEGLATSYTKIKTTERPFLE